MREIVLSFLGGRDAGRGGKLEEKKEEEKEVKNG